MPEKSKAANTQKGRDGHPKPQKSDTWRSGSNKGDARKGNSHKDNSRNTNISRWAAWLGDRLWFVAIVLFIISFAVRLALSFWSGPVVSQIAYPDEIRFFHIARSLAEQGDILVRGVPAAFQKILYSIFIAPAFLVTENQLVQANIIRVINCLLISSTVFPVVLLAKKLSGRNDHAAAKQAAKHDDAAAQPTAQGHHDAAKQAAQGRHAAAKQVTKHDDTTAKKAVQGNHEVQNGRAAGSFNEVVVLIALLITVTLPDMAYSAAILSEVLYMPLCVWLFYVAACAFAEQKQSKRLVLFGGFGLLTHIIYMTKEIAAAFLIAAVLLLLIDGIRARAKLVQNLLSCLAMSAAFFAAFLMLKLTVFQGMGNTYALSNINVNDQITLSVLSSPGVLRYLIYSAIVLLVAAILSFYAGPLLFTLCGYGSMQEEHKKSYLFTVFSLVIMIGAIAYTISIREDLGDPVPRLHMRYITPLVIPVLIQCLDFLLAKAPGAHGKGSAKTSGGRSIAASKAPDEHGKVFAKVFPAALVVLCILMIFLIPRGPESGFALDKHTLRSAYLLESFIVAIGPVSVNLLLMLQKIILMALTVYGSFLVIKKKKKRPVAILLLCVVFLVNGYDNFMSYTIIRRAKTGEFAMAFLDSSASHFDIAFSEEGKALAYDAVDDLIAINDFLRSAEGTAIVVLPPDFAAYADTYLGNNAFPVQSGELYRLAVAGGGSVRMDAQPIWEGNRYNSGVLGLDTWKRGFYAADYIITMADDHPFTNVKIEYRKGLFTVLRNLDPAVIHIGLQ